MKKKNFNYFTFLFGVCIFLFSFPLQAQKVGKISNIVKLTNDDERYVNPQWSPDGTKVAFTNEYCQGIIVFDLKSKSKVQLTDAFNAGDRFQWSADGEAILYRATRYEENDRKHSIWVTDLKGNKQQVSEEQRYLQPAAWRYKANGAKQVLSVDGKIKKQPSLSTIAPSRVKSIIKTSGTNLSTFFDENERFYLVDESGKKTLLNDKPGGLCPAFSPDGKKIAFNQDDEMVVMNIDGTGKRMLGRGFRITWINNEQIIFEVTTDNGHEYTSGELFMMNIDGTNKIQLTRSEDKIEMYPQWSPVQQKLLFTSYTDGQVYMADLN